MEGAGFLGCVWMCLILATHDCHQFCAMALPTYITIRSVTVIIAVFLCVVVAYAMTQWVQVKLVICRSPM